MDKFLEVGVTESVLRKEIGEELFLAYKIQATSIIDSDSENLHIKSKNDFINENSIKIDEMLNEKINEYFNQEYVGIKLTYLNEIYKDDTKGTKTKNTYYTVYKKHIYYLEKASRKDLMEFTKAEIENIFNMALTDSTAVKNSLWTLVNQYLTWCVSKSLISSNVCDLLDGSKLKKIRSKIIKDKYYSKEEVFEICYQAIKYKTRENHNGDQIPVHASKQNVLPLLLARYGITGKKLEDMINLEQGDIDCNSCLITVFNEERTEVKYTVDIDAEFILFYQEAIQETITVKDKELFLSENVLKHTKDGKIPNATIYYNLKSVFENLNIERVTFSDLENSCKIDLLRETELKNKKLSNEDFINIVKKFQSDSSDSTYHNLKRFYETLYPESNILDKKRAKKVKHANQEIVYVRPNRRLKGDDRSHIPTEEYDEYLKRVKIQRLREREGRA